MIETPSTDKFYESELELAILDLFEQQGYIYTHGETISRSFTDTLLEDDLISFLRSRYGDSEFSENELALIINRLKLIPSTPLYDGNKEAFRLINEGFNLVREKQGEIALHVDYIDFDNPENNIFRVVNQFTVEGVKERRPDVLIFINGIPVAIWEFKTAIEEDCTVHDAWEQITIRYTRDIPNLLKYCFLSVISDAANTRLGSIFTDYPFYYSWNKINDEEKAVNGIKALICMVRGAFSKERILSVLRDFVFYPDNSFKSQAIICRYPQFFAANKMLESIGKHLRPHGDGKGGIYFGATGCGKTFTMLFLARMLIKRKTELFGNPTIVLIVDREDLEGQAAKLFVNATQHLGESDVRTIESRSDLRKTLADKPSGGCYITTIQKFCDSTGLLSTRNNIICISDEAHRSQTGINAKEKRTEDGVFTTYGFAKYLRDSFPSATYCGFSGTPIDESLAVFGGIVDAYTMKEASDDGITVRIAYEPRLAKVVLSEEDAQNIQKYYDACARRGATEEQIEASQAAMSKMRQILGHPERVAKLAKDLVTHYETLCAEKPAIVQKAMIVCADRELAYNLLKAIESIRPEWAEKKKAEDDSLLSEDELDKLIPLPKINLVATEGDNDTKGLHEACGDRDYRKMLDAQFKEDKSNFKIAVVVDMWITGFDVPSLAVMYIDKPLQKHTLIQTISRVNRVYDGKDKGLVVDYIGIYDEMMKAIKIYGAPQESPVDNIDSSLKLFRSHLSMLDDLMHEFDAHAYYQGMPLERLMCLNDAVEFVQRCKERENRYMALSRRMKAAFAICSPTGELSDNEIARAYFYLAVRSIIYKQTKEGAPDAETMNRVVAKMVEKAISCSGIESIVDAQKSIDIFSEEFNEKLMGIKLPISKFNALLKMVRKAIKEYGKTNRVKSLEFAEKLRQVVDRYNSRDKLNFAGAVVDDFFNDLSSYLMKIWKDLKADQESFAKMGITYEEKAFYDILIKVRDDHQFEFAEEKALALAKQIKNLVEDKSRFADFSTRNDIRSQLMMHLIILLSQAGYPPEWNREVYEKVMEQAANFKKNH